ncbi:phage tail protein [Anaerococcus marasmi]|uniref:phage tail protein n=1 Tax=Anaerococcus marasmi TaxID=2057797 RepID=UPI000CFA30AE|nr:phage tail protein [Anaerococcus marasmi]
MLVYKNDIDEQFVFSYYRNLYFDVGINELISPVFEIPKEYRHLFEVESQIIEDGQLYDIKNIEPFYGGYKVECRQAVYTLQAKFNKSLNFPHQTFENILKGILPQGWSYKIVGNLKERRTITADHKDSWQVFSEAIKKFNYEYKINSSKQEIIVGKELGTDRGAYFMDDFNIDDKDITEESFEFATRIIPEGMNGLKINQINNGKDYLEDKSYSWKTITYHWKDERYTNIENLKEAAAEKLKVLSRPRMTIKLKVKDLSEAVGVYAQKYEVGDYVYLIDKDRKTKERFRITGGRFYPYKPFENELTLANRPVDIVDDVKETIELTKEMWEETRVRFETTDEAIKSSVSTAKRYTDDSFKTYKTEREQTDSRIYESITESTTYVDPKTGQTKPIIDKQLEIDKTIEGINISLKDQLTANKDFADSLEGIKASISENNININDKIDKDLAKVKKELGDSIDYTKVDFKKRHDLLALELESASKSISEANIELGELSNKFDDFNTTAENKYQIIDKEILGIKSNFKVAREEITAEITSASKTQEQAINQMGKDTEASIKTYLNANYSTKTQTDEKISQEVGSLKTLVNKDIGDLSKEITQAKSKIEQTDNRITSSVESITKGVDAKVGASIEHTNNEVNSLRDYVSKNYTTITQTDNAISAIIRSVEKDISSLSTEVRLTKYGLESKVSANEIISKINQSPEAVKIQARNIDLTGNVSVRGDFTTLNGYGEPGIHIANNQVTWSDDRWTGKRFGEINVTTNTDDASQFSLNMGHYPTGQMIFTYYDNDSRRWIRYMSFDRWNYTRDGGAAHPIIMNEGVRFKGESKFENIIHFKRMRLREYNNGIALENYDGNGIFINTDGVVKVSVGGSLREVATK